MALAALLLAGCSSVRETQPEHTATEQLLLSTAADHAVAKLALDLPSGARVFLDTGNFEGYGQRYALGAIKDRLLRNGVRLVGDRMAADVVVEPRSGALSIDRRETLVGIPSFNLPVPLAGDAKTPELALYKEQRQRGIAKFAVTGYGARDGALALSTGPVVGVSHRTKQVVLFLSWTDDDLVGDGPVEHPAQRRFGFAPGAAVP